VRSVAALGNCEAAMVQPRIERPDFRLNEDHRFGSSEAFSIGVEEELFLVDPLSGRVTDTSAWVLERLGEVDGRVEQELHSCQVEAHHEHLQRRWRGGASPRRDASRGAPNGSGDPRVRHSPVGG